MIVILGMTSFPCSSVINFSIHFYRFTEVGLGLGIWGLILGKVDLNAEYVIGTSGEK